MLPLPGSPASSWSLYRARTKAAFDGADLRVCMAFWLFGVINNIFYVILLSAALDLVGPAIPKATILLASVIPGLSTKLVVPYFIHLVPYSVRVVIFTALSTCGMLLVALSPSRDAGSVTVKIAGIVLANLSSAAGEVNFLSLTHFYGPFSLASWGSGTGGAGLLGAGAYALLTTTFGFSVRATLLASTIIPSIMLLSFFFLLPLEPLRSAGKEHGTAGNHAWTDVEEEDASEDTSEQAGLLDEPSHRGASPAYGKGEASSSPSQRAYADFCARIARARGLVVPYMVPLFLVYVAEYTINQGVAPTLLFPLEESPFKHFRGFYPTYGAIYQLGVFISRSSLPFVRIRSLYIPTFLQILNLAVLIGQALFSFIPNVWFVFAIILWEGLLGGIVYVSTFAAIREDVVKEDREFSLGVTAVSDSAGICVAGLLGVVMETMLCSWQVEHGKDWCRRL